MIHWDNVSKLRLNIWRHLLLKTTHLQPKNRLLYTSSF